MRTLKFITVSFFLVALMISCSKDQMERSFVGAIAVDGSPMIITGANNGGNVTCEEVAAATGCKFDFSSGRIDYSDGTGGITGPITWTTDGTYVTWSSSRAIKVAIIVKGGPNANVYAYCNECKVNSGTVKLSAPINPNNGKPYGLSNITFCYSFCDMPKDLVVALKTFIHNSTTAAWAVSKGDGSAVNDLGIGVGYYNYTPAEFPLIIYGQLSNTIGSIKVSDNGAVLKVVVDTSSDEWLFDCAYLYVGTYNSYRTNYVSILSGGVESTNYGAFPFKLCTPLNSGNRVFEIPFSSITQ
jgi:hypothetical protein